MTSKITPTNNKSTKNNEMIGNLLQDIRLAESLFMEDRIAEAYFLLKNIEEFVEKIEESSRSEVYSAIGSSSKIQAIKNKGQPIFDLLQSFSDKEVWNAWNTAIGPHQDVTVYTHRDEMKGSYHFKIEGYIQSSMKETLAAILENDLYRLWLPLCSNSQLLAKSSTYRRILRNDFDFVLLKKTCLSEVHGDVLPDGTALISLSPLEASEENKKYMTKDPSALMDLWGGIHLKEELREIEYQGPLEANPSEDKPMRKRSKANMRKSVVEAYNIPVDEVYDSDILDGVNNPMFQKSASTDLDLFLSSNEKHKKITKVVKIQAIFKADLKIDFIPDWIFNLAVRSAVSMIIPMLEHQAGLFADQGFYQKRILEQSEIYDEIQSRITDYNNKKK